MIKLTYYPFPFHRLDEALKQDVNGGGKHGQSDQYQG